MTFDELEELVFNSTAADWKNYQDAGVMTYKHDVSIQLKCKNIFELDKFVEPWTEQFPDRNAYRDIYILCYNGNPITEYFFVSVDGGRASLPIPQGPEHLIVSQNMFNLGKVINSLNGYGDYEMYFKWAGFKTE